MCFELVPPLCVISLGSSSYGAGTQLADGCVEMGKVENPTTFDGAKAIEATHRTHNLVQQ